MSHAEEERFWGFSVGRHRPEAPRPRAAGFRVTRVATAKLRVYPALAGLGLLGALAVGRPELAALAAPFAVLVGLGLAFARPPELKLFVELDRERQLEGRPVSLELELVARTSVERLELLLRLPDGLVSGRAVPAGHAPLQGRAAGAPRSNPVRSLGDVRGGEGTLARP